VADLKPKPGEIVEVAALPACDFCGDGTQAEYDFRTCFGSWANGCRNHWGHYRATYRLGVGNGQRLIVRKSA
jgi:hypothetical protein